MTFLPRLLVRSSKAAEIFASLAATVWTSTAQPATFAGDPQHTSTYSTPAQHINALRWSLQIDSASGATAHYGAPIISSSNTLFVPVKTSSALKLSAYDGATAHWKYDLATGYLFPASSWRPAYQPVIANQPSGPRLYYPGPGGTTFYITNIDSDTPSPPVQECFYTDIPTYSTNASNFNATVFINTPLTADATGAVFFGFRISGTAPAPFNATSSGMVRLDPSGQATYVFDGAAAGYSGVTIGPNNCAPALSIDGTTLYVVVGLGPGYLLGLDSVTLATKYKATLYAPISDISTASPTVGPDGDVFFGANSGSRGLLFHYSADLKTQKITGGFGWDNTIAIVPTNMVPSYSGTSSYLLFSKYNNYYGGDGDGVNRIALLDPNATQIDPHPSARGALVMREVLTAIGCVPDSSAGVAVREWCVNTAAVNPPTCSVFCPSEDGRLYRWNLSLNSFIETLVLGNPVSDPYVPTIIGPDGTVYTISGNKLYALGSFAMVSMTLDSSAPDLRGSVLGQPITFSATVSNLDAAGPVPTGTVTFQDLAYEGLGASVHNFASNVSLIDGVASISTSALAAGNGYLGNHFITAFYSGDTNFRPHSVTFVQKVHASATQTKVTLSTSNTNGAVTVSATVLPDTEGIGMPTGQVSFWDGSNLLAQVPLNTNGVAAVVVTNLSGSGQSVTATYASDTFFAASSGPPTPPSLISPIILSNGVFQFAFTNPSGTPFSVLGAADFNTPLSNWSLLGSASEIAPGQFQFMDTDATNNSQRFYRVRSP